jgi:adenosylcobinamide-GDP ribazoletransferase
MDRNERPETRTRAEALLHPGDLGAALMLLSRIPAPSVLVSDRGARTAWAWPLVGALLAALSWAAGAAMLWLSLPPSLAAGGTLATGAVLTGALHEDGLADCADGFWGGHTRERRLEILHDSRIGSYGVIALVLVLGMKWIALAFLFEAGAALLSLLTVGMLSRAGMAGLMAALPFARQDGLAVHVGRPSRTTATAAALIALTGGAVALGVVGMGVALTVLASTAATAGIARKKLGGQTGDVLGASQQVAELVALLTCTALLV